MTPSSTIHPQHPDELLPWFVNQTLTEQEREHVEGHVQGCPRCQQEVALLRQIRDEAKSLSPPLPGELGMQRLLREVRQKSRPSRVQEPVWSWGKGLAIAASLVIVVQAGLLIEAWFFSKPMMPLEPPMSGVVLQISFHPGSTEADIREMVNAIDGTLIGGPGQLGIYRIRLPLERKNETAIEEAVTFLREQKKVVTHVARE